MLTPDETPIAPSERLATLARELGRNDRDWAILAEGNCSSLTVDGTVHVKASGAEMGRATTADFVNVPLADLLGLIDNPLAGDIEVRDLFDAVAARSGGRRPSVESLLHAVCLAQPGITVAGHTHPVPAVLEPGVRGRGMSCARRAQCPSSSPQWAARSS